MGFTGQELPEGLRWVWVRWELGCSALKALIPCSSPCCDPPDPTKPQGLLNCRGPNRNDKLHWKQEDGQEFSVITTRTFYMPLGAAFSNSSLPALSQQQLPPNEQGLKALLSGHKKPP